MKPKSAPSQELDKFILRLPDGMRDRLKEAAQAGGRSLNAEIVLRLEQTFAAAEEIDVRSLVRQLETAKSLEDEIARADANLAAMREAVGKRSKKWEPPSWMPSDRADVAEAIRATESLISVLERERDRIRTGIAGVLDRVRGKR